MPSQTKSSQSKMLSILDLFTTGQPSWSAEGIATKIRCSAPTSYRYLRELVSAGLLMRSGSGNYSLGPRIITLDYQLRTTDPYFAAGKPLMAELAGRTGLDCVMTRLFDEEIVDTHRESGSDNLSLAYGRGRRRPLFLGAAPKVILSTLPKARLQRIYQNHSTELQASSQAGTWEDFWNTLQQIRKAGYYLSKGELEHDVGAMAVPFYGDSSQAVGALALVIPILRIDLMNYEKLLDLLVTTARELARNAQADA